MIELEMDLRRPRLCLELGAEKESLPLVRQSLRAFGELADIEAGASHDAELALTEACANAVRHAYSGRGRIEVSLEHRPGELLATVRDRGRGISGPLRRARLGGRGLGLTLIESIASEVDLRTDPRWGTEIAMALPFPTLGSSDGPHAMPIDSLAHVVRRLVAMVAAQADMTPDRIVEALLVAELVVSNARNEIVGDSLTVACDRLSHGLELRIGPLGPGGAEEVLRKAEVPVLGSVVEQLTDRLWTAAGMADTGEHVAACFAATPTSA